MVRVCITVVEVVRTGDHLFVQVWIVPAEPVDIVMDHYTSLLILDFALLREYCFLDGTRLVTGLNPQTIRCLGCLSFTFFPFCFVEATIKLLSNSAHY